MNKKFLIALAFLFVLVVFSSCEFVSSGFNDDENEVFPSSLENNLTLFVKDEKTGFEIFETDSKKYKNKNGYTIWCMKGTENENSNEDFKELNVTTRKDSGSESCGYGVVFSYNKDGQKSSMLCVMTRIDGKFAVGSIQNGVYKQIAPWTENSAIKQGLGKENIIRIKYENTEYKIFFNDDTTPFCFKEVCEGSKANATYGYVVVIAPNENFPKTKVKVAFKKNN